jgi:hypothetical protein
MHTLTLHIPYDATSSQAATSLRRLRALLPGYLEPVPGVEYAVSGTVAQHPELAHRQHRAEPGHHHPFPRGMR